MARITFLRHGNMEKGTDDSARVLSPKGIEQALARREHCHGPFHTVLVSPAIRARQTAELVCGGRNFVEIPLLYPVGSNATLDNAFARLTHSPLVVYLADSEETARGILSYGSTCWREIVDVLPNSIVGDAREFLVVAHAVLINAVGFAAMTVDIPDQHIGASNLARMLHANFAECEGFTLDLDDEYWITGMTLIKDGVPVTA